MRTAFILFLIGVFFLLAIKSRIAAMYTYWWFAVFRPQEWVWGDISSLRLPLIAAILFVLPSVFYKKIPRFNNPIAVSIISFCLISVVADYVNGCSGTAVKRYWTVFDLFILAYVVLLTTEYLRSRRVIFWLCFVLAVSIGFHSGKGGFYALVTGGDYYGMNKMMGGFMSDSNGFAQAVAMMLFLMIFSLQYIGQFLQPTSAIKSFMLRGIKVGLILVIVGSIYIVVAFQSRGSFLAMASALLLWILLHHHRTKILVLVLAAGVIGLTTISLPERYAERIGSVFAEEDERDKSAASRPHFWMTAVEIAKDYPYGTGPGCYPHYYNFYDESNGEYGYYRAVHSSHFQILSDLGFLGIFFWILIIILYFRKLWWIRKQALEKAIEDKSFYFYADLSNALICLMVVFYFAGSFYSSAYHDIAWLCWGIVIGIDRLFNKEITEFNEKRRLASL